MLADSRSGKIRTLASSPFSELKGTRLDDLGRDRRVRLHLAVDRQAPAAQDLDERDGLLRFARWRQWRVPKFEYESIATRGSKPNRAHRLGRSRGDLRELLGGRVDVHDRVGEEEDPVAARSHLEPAHALEAGRAS